jgi:primosomal protein N' (replication factor Y)
MVILAVNWPTSPGSQPTEQRLCVLPLVSNQLIARVAIESPLPQLDRLFDYRVSDELASVVAIGQRVRVSFGRSKTKVSGFIVELAESSNHDGELATLAELISEAPVLQPEIYNLCRTIADRQATSIADVLRLAVPTRSVAIEKKWIAAKQSATELTSDQSPQHSRTKAIKTAELIRPVSQNRPAWIDAIVDAVTAQVNKRQSAIVCLPDISDVRAVSAALRDSLIEHIEVHSDQKPSELYQAFLNCLSNEFSIVIGNRNALFAPARKSGLIYLWDDGDQSHVNRQSPYVHSRDIALLRQQIDQCDITFASHSRTAEVQRLVDLGYLAETTKSFAPPKISTSDSDARLDTAAWLAMREAAKVGPVLVQVSSRGNAVSLYCQSCSARSACSDCHGPVWANERNQFACRWCNRISLDLRCLECNGTTFKQGRAGANRTSAEIGKMFPGTKVLTSTGAERLIEVADKPLVVVATPGAEPIAIGGYRAVVVLDADQLLRRDTLRATEDAVRAWSNAIALAAPDGRSVLVGLSTGLGSQLALWNQTAIARHELATRSELALPPAVRIATVTSDRKRLEECEAALSKINGVEIFGPSMRANELRLLIKFPYAAGALVAQQLKVLSLSASGGASINSKSGRSQRALRIKVDDPEVI